MNYLLKIYKPALYSLAIILVFFISMLIYFSPVLEGEELRQHDVIQYEGMSKEINDFREETGKEPLWTNSMFGGMPAYLISVRYNNMLSKIHSFFNINHEHPHVLAVLYFICFFIALLLLNVRVDLSMLGALFYGFSSYFFIIIEAGHVTKAIALS